MCRDRVGPAESSKQAASLKEGIRLIKLSKESRVSKVHIFREDS